MFKQLKLPEFSSILPAGLSNGELQSGAPKPPEVGILHLRCADGSPLFSMPDSPIAATTDKLDVVKRIFSLYLDQHGQRKTPERFAILEEIYGRADHFDVESLYIHMKNHNHRVSRATVYNTLDLLVEADLVIKHQFGSNQALYERSFGFRQHDHLLCTDCGKVFEFCDPRMAEIQSTMGNLLGFEVRSHALLLHGKCRRSDCTHLNDLAQTLA